MISGNSRLIKKIVSKIQSKGPVSFKTFMEMALYDPEEGYYTSQVEPFGVHGDYYTSPDVHPLFGRMMARQIAEMAEAMNHPEARFDLVEAGPGSGSLAMTILQTLKEDHPDVFNRLDYYLVEKSARLIKRQKKLFEPYPDYQKKIIWVTSIKDLPSIKGCIFSNELIDAFPVHRVKWNGKIQEIHLDYQPPAVWDSAGARQGQDEPDSVEGELTEVLLPPSLSAITEYFQGFAIDWAEGQEAEVNLEAVSWITEVAEKLTRGYVITIDYGDLAEELYTLKRKNGTFLCYLKHQTRTNPYEWVGMQDITSHVNFSILEAYGAGKGLLPAGFTDQAHFLIGLGILEEMERYVREIDNPLKDPSFRAMKHLIHPDGLGPVFKVFIQQKGMEDRELKGLKFSRKIG